MSAIRNSANRSEARKQRSNPYGRGIFSAVARLVNFFIGSSSEQGMEPDCAGSNAQASAAHSSVQSPRSLLISGNRAPLTPSKGGNGFSSTESSTSLPVPSPEQVATYFSQRMGTNVTPNEVESMITNLQTTPEHERFKFTFTTPGREWSPSRASTHIETNGLPRTTSKKLSRNPNGVYRWEGAGSAKAPRRQNRFDSPAFGASPSKPERSDSQEITEQADLPVHDNKRRKTGDSLSISVHPSEPPPSTSSTIPFPSTSPNTPRVNGNLRSTSPLVSRLRTPAKATAPVNPSPLRQAWSDASSSSSREDHRQSPPVKQTKTANFVAELIKDTAPPNKPDLTNPYQVASPVGKVGPPRRPTRRPRTSMRPAPPSEKQNINMEEEAKKKEYEGQMKALSPQAIIEATLPKGSKRSRPPAHFENTTGDATRSGSPSSSVNYVVEEAGDEVQERAGKRHKPNLEGKGRPSLVNSLDVTVEEVRDVSQQPPESNNGQEKVTEPSNSAALNGVTSTARSTHSTGFKTSSVPKEPSKLRFSIQAESPPSSHISTLAPPTSLPTPTPLLPSTTIPGPSPPSIQTASDGFNFTFKTPKLPASVEAIKPKDDSKRANRSVETTKAQVQSLDAKFLPTFALDLTTTAVLPSTPTHIRAREAARAIPASALPSFDFSLSMSSPESTKSIAGSPVLRTATPPSATDFAGLKSPPSHVAVPAPVKAFDFAAAGMTRPTTPRDTWNCTQCGLSNPQPAMKCSICDEVKPGAVVSKPLSTPAIGAPPATAIAKPFDWNAAGIKPPQVNSDTWICGLCGLSNPKSATKCTTCDTAAPSRSGSATAASY